MRRGIAAIAGRCIEDIRQPKSKLQSIEITPRLADFRRRATGRKILSVGRIGKRVVLELDCPDRIVLEPRMSGLIICVWFSTCRAILPRRNCYSGTSAGWEWCDWFRPSNFCSIMGRSEWGPTHLRFRRKHCGNAWAKALAP